MFDFLKKLCKNTNKVNKKVRNKEMNENSIEYGLELASALNEDMKGNSKYKETRNGVEYYTNNYTYFMETAFSCDTTLSKIKFEYLGDNAKYPYLMTVGDMRIGTEEPVTISLMMDVVLDGLGFYKDNVKNGYVHKNGENVSLDELKQYILEDESIKLAEECDVIKVEGIMESYNSNVDVLSSKKNVFFVEGNNLIH